MKSLIVTLTAAATLAAAPAFAGVADEVVTESPSAVEVVASPAYQKGAGPIVTSEHDGTTEPAEAGEVSVAAYPDAARPRFENRGR
jgi:hypothetical protein